MKNKLWEQSAKLNPAVEAYTVGDDTIYDTKLLPYDLKASLAHAKMLEKISVISTGEYKKIKTALHEIKNLHKEGKFTVKLEQEDCHTAIEQYITAHYGEVGKKIHTARSRNDQALTMMRLYMKQSLEETKQLLTLLVEKYQAKSKQTKNIAMPGYTHMQKAMPTTVGIWLGAYQDAFNDILPLLDAALKLIDQNPLGSAAGFGIEGFKIDKNLTTKEMSFSKVQKNPVYASISRGLFELSTVAQMGQISLLASKFASDMMLFTTQEFSYFSLPKEYTTGSSIMPNKNNYDLFEIMRGNGALVTGYQSQLQLLLTGLSSGFHRDLQLGKEPLIKSVEITTSTLKLLIEVVPKIKVNEDKLKESMTEDLFATKQVYELVASGIAFRDAYGQVKANLEAKD